MNGPSPLAAKPRRNGLYADGCLAEVLGQLSAAPLVTSWE
jgi:hypothetical protein